MALGKIEVTPTPDGAQLSCQRPPGMITYSTPSPITGNEPPAVFAAKGRA